MSGHVPQSEINHVITIWLGPSANPLNGWDAQLSVTAGMTLIETGAGGTALEAARNMLASFEEQAIQMALSAAENRAEHDA